MDLAVGTIFCRKRSTVKGTVADPGCSPLILYQIILVSGIILSECSSDDGCLS